MHLPFTDSNSHTQRDRNQITCTSKLLNYIQFFLKVSLKRVYVCADWEKKNINQAMLL